MVAHAYTVAFRGMEARRVDVQCHLSPGLPAFTLVGLADKAVAESRERVRAALHAMGLAMPAKRVTVNLAPADLPKEGAHYDLAIALSLMAALEAIPREDPARYIAMGELGLDGGLAPIAGALPGALAAAEADQGFICPAACGPEAALLGEAAEILAPDSLLALANHFNGRQALARPHPVLANEPEETLDLRDVRGQETAKRALEVAAAGGHNLLMIGPPGAGKSMLAARLPGLLPPLSAREALEVSMVRSLAGEIESGRLSRTRPYRAPHHAASAPAIIGGGRIAKPGEVSLAHCGVLFLDELPEFARPVLEALRQPLESGEAVIARVNAHARYPARVQLVAAMNPCRCGYLADPNRACARAPTCGLDYQARLSGPLLDRIDLQIELPPVSIEEMRLPAAPEGTREAAARVASARARQARRFEALDAAAVRLNAHADGALLDAALMMTAEAENFAETAADRLQLSARGYRRVLRVARTIADLAGSETTETPHIAEAASYRRAPLTRPSQRRARAR